MTKQILNDELWQIIEPIIPKQTRIPIRSIKDGYVLAKKTVKFKMGRLMRENLNY